MKGELLVERLGKTYLKGFSVRSERLQPLKEGLYEQ